MRLNGRNYYYMFRNVGDVVGLVDGNNNVMVK